MRACVTNKYYEENGCDNSLETYEKVCGSGYKYINDVDQCDAIRKKLELRSCWLYWKQLHEDGTAENTSGWTCDLNAYCSQTAGQPKFCKQIGKRHKKDYFDCLPYWQSKVPQKPRECKKCLNEYCTENTKKPGQLKGMNFCRKVKISLADDTCSNDGQDGSNELDIDPIRKEYRACIPWWNDLISDPATPRPDGCTLPKTANDEIRDEVCSRKEFVDHEFCVYLRSIVEEDDYYVDEEEIEEEVVTEAPEAKTATVKVATKFELQACIPVWEKTVVPSEAPDCVLGSLPNDEYKRLLCKRGAYCFCSDSC